MKAIVSKTIAKKKMKKYIIICAAVSAVLVALLILCLKLTWRPTILEKVTFTDDEKAVIAQQLGIPNESICIEKMRYNHAKDSYFCITVTADDLSTLNAYKPSEDSTAENEVYIKKDEDDPHGDITCTVRTKDPYTLDFELYKWNRELYDIIEK